MFLTNWIDKKLAEIQDDYISKKYFTGKNIEIIEDTNYLIDSDNGIEIILSDILVVRSIHIFSQRPNIKGYNGEIPFNLSFSMSQSAVYSILGLSSKKGGGYKDVFGYIPLWDKFIFETYSLHLQYSEDKTTIDLITIASLSLEAYFNKGLQ